MANVFPSHRSADTTYGANLRWRRELAQLEHNLNGAISATGYAPFDISNLRTIPSTAASLVVADELQKYANLVIQLRENNISGRAHSIVSQFYRDLQKGQAVVVTLDVQRVPEVRVSASRVEPLRPYNQLRGASDAPLVTSAPEPTQGGFPRSRESVAVIVRKARDEEHEKCLVAEFSPNQPITTRFRIAETNDSTEVRTLNIPDELVRQDEIVTDAPSPIFDRPPNAFERHAIEERFRAARTAAEQAMRAERNRKEAEVQHQFDTRLP